MKRYFWALMSLICAVFQAQAQDDKELNESILLYCGFGESEYQQEVEIGDGVKLSLNKNGFEQIQHIEPSFPEASFIERELNSVNVSDDCSEYLFSQSSVVIDSDRRTLARIYFDFDESVLTERSKYILTQVLGEIEQSSKHLSVIGHSDSMGSVEYNYQLGLSRSYSAMRYLIAHGADPTRLAALSKGETEPIGTNDTEGGRSTNRRVEIKL